MTVDQAPASTSVGQDETSRVLQPCGTPAAYQRHWRRGERPCRPCVEAHYASRPDTYRAYQRARLRALTRVSAVDKPLFRQLVRENRAELVAAYGDDGGTRKHYWLARARARSEMARRFRAKFAQFLDEELAIERACQAGMDRADGAGGGDEGAQP